MFKRLEHHEILNALNYRILSTTRGEGVLCAIFSFLKRDSSHGNTYFWGLIHTKMEVSGKIKWLDETKTYGNNGFRKREVVVTTEEQYPQHILVEFVQDKCDLLNNFQLGQNVKIGINLRGREWVNPQGETKYFNSVQGWRIEASGAAAPSQEMPPMPPASAFEAAPEKDNEVEDDLPF